MLKDTPKSRKMLQALKDVARVASNMVDGDEARRIVTDRAAHYVANPDPKYRSLAGDYYDVDHATFLRVKKTLMRLQRLVDFRCNAVLWLTLDALEGKVTVVCNNGTLSRWHAFGRATVPIEGEISECMASKAIVVAGPTDKTDLLTVVAPVLDSLGDVVGVVELTAQHPSTKEIEPVWN